MISQRFKELYQKVCNSIKEIQTEREMRYIFSDAHIKKVEKNRLKEEKKQDKFIQKFNRRGFITNKGSDSRSDRTNVRFPNQT